MKEEKSIAQVDAATGVQFTELEKLLADRGISLDRPDVAASLEQIKQKVDAGEVVLTQTMLTEIAAALDERQAGEGELREEELESVAGGAVIGYLAAMVLSKIVSDCISDPEGVANAFNDGRSLAKKY